MKLTDLFKIIYASKQVEDEYSDLIENVKAAGLLGINAIHYSNYDLLSKELKDLGVPVP